MIIIVISSSTTRILNMAFDQIIDIIDQCLGWPWRVEGSERQAEHFQQGRTTSFREKDYDIISRNKLNSSIIVKYNHLGVATQTATKPKPAPLPGWREGRASGRRESYFEEKTSNFCPQQMLFFHGHDVRQSWNWVALIELVARLTLLNQYLIFSRVEIQ